VLSAVATRGICADLMNLVLAEHELVLGETVLSELGRVLNRKMGIPKVVIAELDAFLRQRATVIPKPDQPVETALDAADAAVLTEAAAGADVLVTGDQQLLELQHPPVPMLSPRGLWDHLRGSSPP
jgi:predicted nucleic acid-binding protein